MAALLFLLLLSSWQALSCSGRLPGFPLKTTKMHKKMFRCFPTHKKKHNYSSNHCRTLGMEKMDRRVGEFNTGRPLSKRMLVLHDIEARDRNHRAKR